MTTEKFEQAWQAHRDAIQQKTDKQWDYSIAHNKFQAEPTAANFEWLVVTARAYQAATFWVHEKTAELQAVKREEGKP